LLELTDKFEQQLTDLTEEALVELRNRINSDDEKTSLAAINSVLAITIPSKKNQPASTTPVTLNLNLNALADGLQKMKQVGGQDDL